MGDQTCEELLAECLDPAYRPIVAIHHQLRQQNKYIYEELQTDKFFSIRMVGVENSKRGMGVATELIRRSILFLDVWDSKESKLKLQEIFQNLHFPPSGCFQPTPSNTKILSLKAKKYSVGWELKIRKLLS